MERSIQTILDEKDFEGLKQALSQNPKLANEGLPFDAGNTTLQHPLHRLCDRVFSKEYSDEEAIKMAEIFLDSGANISGFATEEGQDTPLLAAASLNADQLALLYMEHGADIHHRGLHGGTALHWASWCGREVVVNALVSKGAEINRLCSDFKATTLFWAIHRLRNNRQSRMDQRVECVRILLEHGADKTIPNVEGKTVQDLLEEDDYELKELLE